MLSWDHGLPMDGVAEYQLQPGRRARMTHEDTLTGSLVGRPGPGLIELRATGGRSKVREVNGKGEDRSRLICSHLTYTFRLEGERVVGWAPVAPVGRELGLFLKYCDVPRAPRKVDSKKFFADPLATLGDVSELAVQRLDKWLPAGFGPVSRLLFENGARAGEMYAIYFALSQNERVSPKDYCSWLRRHGLDLLEGEGLGNSFAVLNRVTVDVDDRRRIEGALRAVILEAEGRGHTAVHSGMLQGKAMAKLGLKTGDTSVHGVLYPPKGEPRQSNFYSLKDEVTHAAGVEPQWWVLREPVSVDEEHLALGVLAMSGPPANGRGIRSVLGRAVLEGEQVKVADAVSNHRLVVVTGEAGTGKTEAVRKVGEALQRAGKRVVWTATTGRAARVLHSEGSTLHRFLGIRPGAVWPRVHDPVVDLLIVDEVSMMDALLGGPLGVYMQGGTVKQIVLIGDPSQLPPVRSGKVLHDLVAAGILEDGAVVDLTDQHRSNKEIVGVAEAIREGAPLPDLESLKSVSVLKADESVQARILELAGGHPDVVVIAPEYRGPLGVSALNAALRDVHLGVSEEAWLPGEVVVQRQNKEVGSGTDASFMVANGEFGRVAAVGADGVTVDYDDGRTVTWSHLQCPAEGGLISPGYALTVHRAQGGEASRAIVVATGDSAMWRNPAMGYTAVTRAVDELFIVGEPELLRGEERQGVEERRTMFQERVGRLRAKAVAV